jgi:hypothetical protein
MGPSLDTRIPQFGAFDKAEPSWRAPQIMFGTTAMGFATGSTYLTCCQETTVAHLIVTLPDMAKSLGSGFFASSPEVKGDR